MDATTAVKGRYAPSPTGRMHLGNIFAALISWLSAKSKGGSWLLRIEDLDPQRSKPEFARLIEDDLRWLGLFWDEGGTDSVGPSGPYCQSLRSPVYERYLEILKNSGYTYPCRCTRAEIMATQAPHQSDGRVIYGGNCRPASMPQPDAFANAEGKYAVRLFVPDKDITFTDGLYGTQHVNLSHECGDFIIRRADNAWAYQLAVVVDDALMGVTEVVRGSDLLLSAAQQLYLYNLLGFNPPHFAHVPLLCNENGQRLSKRDKSLSMEYLRANYSPEQIIGKLACLAGITPDDAPRSASSLLPLFSWSNIRSSETISVNLDLF